MKKEFNYWQSDKVNFHPFNCINNCGNLRYKKDDIIYCDRCGYEQKISDWHKKLLIETYKSHRIKITPYFKWFDFWIGWFYDSNKNILYIGLLPMIGIKIEL